MRNEFLTVKLILSFFFTERYAHWANIINIKKQNEK